MPDEKYGEELCAWVQMRAGAEPLDAEAVRAFCDGKLAHYKIPRYVMVVEEFPMTVTGKIRKVADARGVDRGARPGLSPRCPSSRAEVPQIARQVPVIASEVPQIRVEVPAIACRGAPDRESRCPQSRALRPFLPPRVAVRATSGAWAPRVAVRGTSGGGSGSSGGDFRDFGGVAWWRGRAGRRRRRWGTTAPPGARRGRRCAARRPAAGRHRAALTTSRARWRRPARTIRAKRSGSSSRSSTRAQ